MSDRMLELAPEAEPPFGFELRVLGSFEPPAVVVARRRLSRGLLALAAALGAAALTAGGLLLSFRDDRRLADRYRATLTEAHGSAFDAFRLRDGSGREGGVLFVYRGAPSWLMATIAPRLVATASRVELLDAGGREVTLGWARFSDGSCGGAVPGGLRRVVTVRVLDGHGRMILSAPCASDRSFPDRRAPRDDTCVRRETSSSGQTETVGWE